MLIWNRAFLAKRLARGQSPSLQESPPASNTALPTFRAFGEGDRCRPGRHSNARAMLCYRKVGEVAMSGCRGWIVAIAGMGAMLRSELVGVGTHSSRHTGAAFAGRRCARGDGLWRKHSLRHRYCFVAR